MPEDSKGIFEHTLRMIKENKATKDGGGYNSIPFGLPSLDKNVPGVMRGLQYIITANSGVGKTQLTKFLFVNQPYKFVKEHPELGLKLRVLYFALEESKEEFMLSLISNRLKERHGITVSVMAMRSMGDHSLTDDIVKKIEESREYFAELEEGVEVVDHISHPTGIQKYVKSYALNHGKQMFKEQTWKNSDANGVETSEKVQVYDRYVPDNPNEFVVVVVDHISLLAAEKTGPADTLHSAMTMLSAEYGRKLITKQFGYCLAIVQQQAAEKEKQQYTSAGLSIEAKLEPSLEGLANNKETQRDALIVMGLFAPERYGIDKHLGYDIKTLKDYYRSLSILKNRIGTPNLKLPLLFNGATNTFSELPKLETPELVNLYSQIKKFRGT